MARLSQALHDLCQPLTALQCRLYLTTLPDQDGAVAGEQELREAIRGSLVECGRVMASVRLLQDRLQM